MEIDSTTFFVAYIVSGMLFAIMAMRASVANGDLSFDDDSVAFPVFVFVFLVATFPLVAFLMIFKMMGDCIRKIVTYKNVKNYL